MRTQKAHFQVQKILQYRVFEVKIHFFHFCGQGVADSGRIMPGYTLFAQMVPMNTQTYLQVCADIRHIDNYGQIEVTFGRK